jgi:hypothetical protein
VQLDRNRLADFQCDKWQFEYLGRFDNLYFDRSLG